MSNTPEDLVDEFLNSDDARLSHAGMTCRTCSLKPELREKVEAACIAFNKKRAERETTVSWQSFTKHVLRAKLKYPYQWRAIRSHLQNCMGIEVA